MALISRETDLKKLLGQDSPSGFYLLYGEEKYLVRRYTELLLQKIGATEVVKFDQDYFDVDEIYDSLTMVTFGGENRCILLTDVDVEALTDQTFKKLAELFSSPAESGCLVLSYPTFDPAKSGQNFKKITALISKTGVVAELTKLTEQETVRFIEERFVQSGCKVTQGVCSYLYHRCGDELNLLTREIDKLCAYRPEQEISRQHIDALCTEQLSASAFEISRKLMVGDLGGALLKLCDLFELKEDPIAVLAALSTTFIDLYRVKVLLSSGIRENELSKHYSYKGREFRISNAVRDGRRYSAESIRSVIDVLIGTDKLLKSSRTDKKIVLDHSITHIYTLLGQGGSRYDQG